MTSLWKVCSNKKHAEIDVTQLINRLEMLKGQNNVEIIQLVIQSILEEISDHQVK